MTPPTLEKEARESLLPPCQSGKLSVCGLRKITQLLRGVLAGLLQHLLPGVELRCTPCPCLRRHPSWRQNGVQHPVCWACWLSYRTGWPLSCYAVPVLPYLPQALPPPPHRGGRVDRFFMCPDGRWALTVSPEPGSLPSPCPRGGAWWVGLSFLASHDAVPFPGPCQGLARPSP